ncbi:MAG: stage II sporulation protein P [Lachnospiraceae bacterium]|nr:stage II sporulation protein P [Lachnospiraceae bacterium]
MRKSTLWLAVLFSMCVLAAGWKYTPVRLHIKESVSEWAGDFSLQRLKDFLTWRSPGIAFEKKAEEEERLIEAEQQAYAVQMENESWKKKERETEENPTEAKQVNEGNGEKNKNSSVADVEKGEEEEKKDDADTKKAAKAGEMSFSEYIQTAVAENQLQYSWDQLTDFDFVTDRFYQIHSSTTIYPSQLDLEKFLKKDLSINRDTEGPQILIYHTHGSEDFKDSDKEDPDTLITGVGEVLKKILEEEYGYRVYHDTTVFPYNSSYSRGREKVKELMEKYPDIQVVIDMHRDSAPNTHLVTEIDGKPTAQIMFFNGMSQTTSGPLTSRSNDNLEDNLAFSLQMKLAAEQLYPGFARKNYLKAYRYNMDLAERYTLIEVGAETNTLQEEINAMEPLAQIIHCVLQ